MVKQESGTSRQFVLPGIDAVALLCSIHVSSDALDSCVKRGVRMA